MKNKSHVVIVIVLPKMNFNAILREKLDKEFPPKKYVCGCNMLCERFGGVELCDCEYCGTAGIDLYRSESDIAHYERDSL